MLNFNTSKKTQNFLIAKNQSKLKKVFAPKKIVDQPQHSK